MVYVLREIDRDNCTNVWRYDEKGREAFRSIIKYISNKKNNFFSDLEKVRVDLPDVLLDQAKKSKDIKSFCSKVCKYLDDYVYKNNRYYINDKYIRHALPFYLDKYNVKIEFDNKKFEYKSYRDFDKLPYKELFICLDELKDAASRFHKEKILKKNDLDHIIWYCYKSFYAYN